MFKNLIDTIALYVVRFIFFMLLHLKPKHSETLAYLLTRLILFFMPRHRYVAFRNMDIIFPGISLENKRILLKKNYLCMAKNITGFINGSRLTQEKVLESLDVSEAEDGIKEVSKERATGCLLIIPHVGPFELLAHYWALYHTPSSIIARGFGLPRLDAWWNQIRSTHKNKVFMRKGGYKSIVSEIKKGNNVVSLFDQNVKPNHATFVPFFETLAATTKSTAIASLRTDCPIIFAAMIETGPSKYKLYAYPVTKPNDRSGNQEEKINATIKEANTYLEEIIKKYPEQWFWIHRRFKTRPNGETENMYDRKTYPIQY
jgi:Kdo2-lipid IVA lauroyltransferase/acyltransferase